MEKPSEKPTSATSRRPSRTDRPVPRQQKRSDPTQLKSGPPSEDETNRRKLRARWLRGKNRSRTIG